MNRLYYGDNLTVLRRLASTAGAWTSIYLDPPFNSPAGLTTFSSRSTAGEKSRAQIEAFTRIHLALVRSILSLRSTE